MAAEANNFETSGKGAAIDGEFSKLVLVPAGSARIMLEHMKDVVQKPGTYEVEKVAGEYVTTSSDCDNLPFRAITGRGHWGEQVVVYLAESLLRAYYKTTHKFDHEAGERELASLTDELNKIWEGGGWKQLTAEDGAEFLRENDREHESGESYYKDVCYSFPPQVREEIGFHSMSVPIGSILKWIATDRESADPVTAREYRRIADTYYGDEDEDDWEEGEDSDDGWVEEGDGNQEGSHTTGGEGREKSNA